MTIGDYTNKPELPSDSYLPINRCNLPAKILGSLTFQRYPTALFIDGVLELHRNFFHQLDHIPEQTDRAFAFIQYMETFFSLSSQDKNETYDRLKADYLCMLRGWLFDSNQKEGAVIKGWVESRFGLLPRWHKTKINTAEDKSYAIFMHERTTGVYNTNAIEAQLDLLYAYCQYELHKLFPENSHQLLYRGIDDLHQYDIFEVKNHKRSIILANNINSLSSCQERADEFGATLFSLLVPIEKIFYFNNLIPGRLQGEREFMAIGGMYEIRLL